MQVQPFWPAHLDLLRSQGTTVAVKWPVIQTVIFSERLNLFLKMPAVRVFCLRRDSVQLYWAASCFCDRVRLQEVDSVTKPNESGKNYLAQWRLLTWIPLFATTRYSLHSFLYKLFYLCLFAASKSLFIFENWVGWKMCILSTSRSNRALFL